MDPDLLRSSAELAKHIQFLDMQTIQKIISQHLEEVTKARAAFLALAPSQDTSDWGWTVSVIHGSNLPIPIHIFAGTVDRDTLFHSSNSKAWLSKNQLSPEAQKELDNLLGWETSDCMVVPVRRPDTNRVFLVAVLADKRDESSTFGHSDFQAVHQCFGIQVLGRLVSAVEYEEEKRQREQCQSLLAVAEKLFSHLDDLEQLLKGIMNEARRLVNAERCSFFLLEKQHNSKVPRLVAKAFDGPDHLAVSSTTAALGSCVIPAEYRAIAGHVAVTGQLLNIADAYSHPLFCQEVDKATGFKTRSILCFPIKNADDTVLGVAELCNKLVSDGMTTTAGFTRADEEMVAKLATYCGISLVQGLRYKKVRDAQHRSYLSNELMMYHMKVSNDEMLKLLQDESFVVDCIHGQFCEFSFIPRSMDELNTPAAVVAVFHDLGLKDRWSINKETLSRFVLMVRKGYRDPPYHNWMHAFSVFHFSYLLIKRLRLVERGYLTDLETLALLVSSLCHDVDHRGTTNSFQLASNSVLAALYSSEGSVMERHHFAQTMCILNTESCNIFENLSSTDYTRCLDLMQDIILATDLAHHLRIFSNLKNLVESGYDAKRADHHQLLLYLLMTSADLSDQTKDWKSSRNAALLVYREFFSQGDLEKAMGNRPVEMMDRDKACIPTLQIQFIDDVALPVYSLLAQLFPEVKALVDSVNSNRQHWVTLEDGHIVSPMEILTNDID